MTMRAADSQKRKRRRMSSETHVERRRDGIREVLILSLKCLHVHVRGDEGQRRIEVERGYLQVRVLDGRFLGSVGRVVVCVY
jgi:hypothetical protein